MDTFVCVLTNVVSVVLCVTALSVRSWMTKAVEVAREWALAELSGCLQFLEVRCIYFLSRSQS
jgi:hypothetical protein